MIQDNKLNIVISNEKGESDRFYYLSDGSFKIKDHKVTSGQPIDIKNGDVLFCGSDGELNFRVGRKESEDVANWFNEKCDPNTNTTFGHRAEKLNFAFIGTLKLKISHERRYYLVTFEDVLIAQGHAGATNNWWFGGKTCFRISDGKVISNASTEDRNNFKFTFLRGENENVHTVNITNIQFFTWMKNIDENKLLSQINIPGTHDSGTFNFNAALFSLYVQTQNLSIKNQLNLGIRFLDIRCRHTHDSFSIYHGQFYCNLTFDEVLEQCTSFLSENESECVVMLIKEESDPEGNTREFYETFLYYVDKYNDCWYHNNTIPNLKEARKKIVLMYRFDFKENSFGINCTDWKDNRTFTIENTISPSNIQKLRIQDQYSVYWSEKSEAITELVKESNKREKYWYLNFISLSPTVQMSIPPTSEYFNKIIYKEATDVRMGFLGLVIMDYPNKIKGLTSIIIDNNNYNKV